MREIQLKTEVQTMDEVSGAPEYYAKIAKDAGFYFCQKRGRIDWNKIHAVDVDRLVQERDIMTLRANLFNVTNYSLETEYDVRVLDTNFVKLFKLAQLSVDYLMFMEEYTSKQTIKIKAQLNTALEENEKLKNECRRKSEELKYTKKCLRERENIKKVLDQYKTQYYMNFISQCFKCTYCDKSFLNGTFLDAHVARRHPKDPEREVQKHPKEDNIETGALFKEINELRDRLYAAEQILHKAEEENVLYHGMVKQLEKAIEDKLTEFSQSNKKQELANLHQILQAEIEKTVTASPMEIKTLHEVTQEQEKKIKYLEELLNAQAENAQKTIKEQLHSQEQGWQHRLQELEQQHADALKKVEELTQKLEDRTGELEGSADKASLLTYEARLNQLHQLSLQQENQLQQQSNQIEQMKKALIDGMPIHKPKVKFNEPDVQMDVYTETKKHMSASSSSSSSPSMHTTRMPGKFSSCPGSKVSDFSSPERPVPVYMVKGKNQDNKLNASPVAEKFNKKHEILEKGKPVVKYVSEKVGGEKDEVDGEEEEEEEVEEEEEAEEEEEIEEEEEEEEEEEITSELVKDVLPQKRKFHGTSNQLQADLRKELQLILDRRLREMGVDPDWSHLPRASLQHKMKILKHHQHIAAKRYADYFKLREFLLNDVRQRITTLVGTKTFRDDTSRKKTAVIRDGRSSQVDSIVNRVKRKALAMSQSENIGNPSLKLSGEKFAVSKHKLETGSSVDENMPLQINQLRTSMKTLHAQSNVPSQRKVHKVPTHRASSVKEGNTKFTKSEIEPKLAMDYESEETSTESSLTTVVSPRRTEEKQSLSGPTFSSTGLRKTQDERKLQMPQHAVLLQDSTVVATRSSVNQNTVPKKKSENPQLLNRINNTDNQREMTDTNKPNSALKMSSSSSSLTKKHVVFQDLAVKYSSTSSEKEQERHSATWDSSDDEAIEPIKNPLKKISTDIQPAKQKDNSSGSIVAQKSREIEQKISTRKGKPIGGVDTVGYLSASTTSASQDLVDYTQIKQTHSSTMVTKQLPLSEWDIEDLEDIE